MKHLLIMEWQVLAVLIIRCFGITSGTEMSQYLHDTIKDLKLKTYGRNVPIGSSQPSLNTLSLRRVYQPHPQMAAPNFGQEHDSLSAEVDKIMDNVAAMVSSASDDNDEVPPAPAPRPRAPPQTPQAPAALQNGQNAPVPALHLTKAELASLYANAVHKGETIKLDGGGDDNRGPGEPLTAAVHELDAGGGKPNLNGAKRPENGYYYYYYPLKSFMDELASSPSGVTPVHQNSSASAEQNTKSSRKTGQFQTAQTFKTPTYHQPPAYHHHYDPYYHTHSHHHNIHIEAEHQKKGLEPLFMAISGFIGMTVMFILSVLVLPKLKKLKPKGLRREGLEEEEFYGIARVALEAIDGYDCTERFACEAGKTAHAFGLLNNRFVKFLKRIGPFALVTRINKVGKYTDKKYRCSAIRCKTRADKTNKAKA